MEIKYAAWRRGSSSWSCGGWCALKHLLGKKNLWSQSNQNYVSWLIKYQVTSKHRGHQLLVLQAAGACLPSNHVHDPSPYPTTGYHIQWCNLIKPWCFVLAPLFCDIHCSLFFSLFSFIPCVSPYSRSFWLTPTLHITAACNESVGSASSFTWKAAMFH